MARLTTADLERRSRAEERIAEAARRTREARELYDSELAIRDRAIVEELDAGNISTRRAARAAGFRSVSGVTHLVARSG